MSEARCGHRLHMLIGFEPARAATLGLVLCGREPVFMPASYGRDAF